MGRHLPIRRPWPPKLRPFFLDSPAIADILGLWFSFRQRGVGGRREWCGLFGRMIPLAHLDSLFRSVKWPAPQPSVPLRECGEFCVAFCSSRFLFFRSLLAALMLGLLPSMTSAALVSGHLLVSDVSTGGIGELIEVDPATGAQTIFSSGGLFQHPSGIAFASDGTVIVSDRVAHAIIAVNPQTGTQTVVSSGGMLGDPVNVNVAANGDIIVCDPAAFGGNPGGVIRINPTTGLQTAVASGGHFVVAIGLAVEASGTFLVGDRGPQAWGPDGIIIRITPDTGSQVVLAQGGLLWNPDHLAIGINGDIFVADHDSPDGGGSVFRIDPVSGLQSAVSSGGFFSGGTSGIAIAADGNIYVSDFNAIDGNGAIFSVNPITGQQFLVSSDGYFHDPKCVAVIPTPEPGSLALLGIVGSFCVCGIRRRKRT
jgi:sugar lactone lactonase YvrE